MGAQVLLSQGPPQTMQGMRRTGRRHQTHTHQRAPEEARWHMGRHGKIGFTGQQGFAGSTHHGFDHLNPGPWRLVAKARQAVQQQPGWKQDLRRQPDLRLPTRRELASHLLQVTRLTHQRQGPPVKHFAGGGEHRLAALDLKGLDAQL